MTEQHVAEVMEEYTRDELEEMVHQGTYLNPLDSKLLTGLMTILVLITSAMCIAKLCKLHLSLHPTIHQYIIFYCGTIQGLLCAIHWILGQYTQLDFVVQYLKLLQLLMVSQLYWSLAVRSPTKENTLTRFVSSMFLLVLLYLTIVVILGCVQIATSWVECFQPYWLLLSGAEFVMVQLFMIVGIYISKQVNGAIDFSIVRPVQKRELWILIFAFEVSALCGITYDITLRLLANEDIGCRGIFEGMAQIYSLVFGSLTVIKLLLPIWAMLFVFHPIDTHDDRDELLPQASGEWYTSVFRPHFGHRYRPLSHPGSDLLTSDTDTTALPGPEQTTPVFGPLRKNTLNLPPIREEMSPSPIVDNGEFAPI